MPRTASFSLSLLLLAVASVQALEEGLNGAWIAREATRNGEKIGAEFFEGASVEFADGKYTATLGGLTEKGTFKVERSRKPHTIDLKASEGQNKGRPMLGIFELDGDTLRFCFNLETRQRPTDFTSTAENKHYVLVYHRKK